MADLTSLTSSAKDSIGRYFSVVSVLPSVLLVVWILLLVSSGAWAGRPNIERAFDTLAGLGIGQIAALVLASLLAGLVLHPLQFAFVQLLEGYWGLAPALQQARQRRIWHHYRRLKSLRDTATASVVELGSLEERIKKSRLTDDVSKRRQLHLASTIAEADRVTEDLPAALTEVMPTRLGNVLRCYERKAGAPYGLDAVRVLPYLSRVAQPGDMEYVNDQRSQLDLAVRMTVTSLLACGLGVLFLGRHGLWLLVALLPYSAAYLSYRGAVVAAAEYGRSLAVVIALNRFALYERLRVTVPEDTRDEREKNEILGQLLAYGAGPGTAMPYVGSSPPAGTTPLKQG